MAAEASVKEERQDMLLEIRRITRTRGLPPGRDHDDERRDARRPLDTNEMTHGATHWDANSGR
jgi:hypothetical protein